MKKSIFSILLFICGLALHWSTESGLDLLNAVTKRTSELSKMAQMNPKFYDDWESQEIAQKRLLQQLAEYWISNLSELSKWYKSKHSNNRAGFDSLIRKIIVLNDGMHLSADESPDFNSLFPGWSTKPEYQITLRESDMTEGTQLEQSIGLLNACYMQGSDYYPGWGYQREGYSYYCGQEVSREFINSYWMNEKQRVSVNSSTEIIMKLSAAKELKKLAPTIILGKQSKTEIDGKLLIVVRVKFNKKMTIKTKMQHKYGTERVWVELFEGKTPSWPWDTVNYKFVGNTYTEVHGPTGVKIITAAKPLSPDDKEDKDDDYNYGPIIAGELKIIDGVKYQMGYQLRFWENEVLGTSVGIVNQEYLPCQNHRVEILKSKLSEFEAKIPNMKMESGDLYHFRDGKEILYRRVSFTNSYKYRISREWFNQRLREYFNIYRRRVDAWFPNWERMSGKRETEREWNINTLAFKIKIIGESQCK